MGRPVSAATPDCSFESCQSHSKKTKNPPITVILRFGEIYNVSSIYNLTMELASTRTERSATVLQQIEPHLAHLDLESIKQIAETDKDYFPKDFIAQCLKHCSHPDHIYLPEVKRLFLDAFTWSVEEFGPTSPGYYGLGKSKEEVIDLQDDLEVLGDLFHVMSMATSDVFQNLSLVVAKSLIESFGEGKCMCDAMGVYLIQCYEYTDDPPSPRPGRWGKFKMMVEYLRKQAVTDEDEDNEKEDWTTGGDGKVLIGHALLLLYARGVVWKITPSLLLFAKEHQPNIFFATNNQGWTLLDIAISNRIHEESFSGFQRREIARLIVQDNPDACLQRGRDGRLPIHLALQTRDKCLFDFIFNAVTSVADQECPKTHLYPYQLTAVSNTPEDEAPDWSDEEERFGGEYADPPHLLLSRIYELLRQLPNLVGDGISPDCRMLSHPESIAIAREELEVAHLRERHFQIESEHRQIEREQAAKIKTRKGKHRSSSQASRKSLKR